MLSYKQLSNIVQHLQHYFLKTMRLFNESLEFLTVKPDLIVEFRSETKRQRRQGTSLSAAQPTVLSGKKNRFQNKLHVQVYRKNRVLSCLLRHLREFWFLVFRNTSADLLQPSQKVTGVYVNTQM